MPRLVCCRCTRRGVIRPGRVARELCNRTSKWETRVRADPQKESRACGGGGDKPETGRRLCTAELGVLCVRSEASRKARAQYDVGAGEMRRDAGIISSTFALHFGRAAGRPAKQISHSYTGRCWLFCTLTRARAHWVFARVRRRRACCCWIFSHSYTN